MQVPGVGDRAAAPAQEAWGAGFVHALRQARAVSPTSPSGPTRPAAPAARATVGPEVKEAPTRRPRSNLWERLVNLLGDTLRGALDLLRSGLDAALRALGGH